jgi:hypothetical protein
MPTTSTDTCCWTLHNIKAIIAARLWIIHSLRHLGCSTTQAILCESAGMFVAATGNAFILCSNGTHSQTVVIGGVVAPCLLFVASLHWARRVRDERHTCQKMYTCIILFPFPFRRVWRPYWVQVVVEGGCVPFQIEQTVCFGEM